MIYDYLLQEQLFASSAIKALLSTDPNGVGKALYNDLVIPGELGKEATSINFYSSNEAITDGYGEENFTVNCRAPGFVGSKNLALTVRDELHRSNNAANDTLFVCDIQRTLPPFDDTDNYNTVMNIRITTRA